MKLLMKQRVFSWTDTYDVYDEAGNKKYFVKAELFRLGHQIHVFDVSGNEIGMIKQRLFTLLPSFDIVISGREFGNIQKEFTFFKPRYEIDYKWRQFRLSRRWQGQPAPHRRYIILFYDPRVLWHRIPEADCGT